MTQYSVVNRQSADSTTGFSDICCAKNNNERQFPKKYAYDKGEKQMKHQVTSLHYAIIVKKHKMTYLRQWTIKRFLFSYWGPHSSCFLRNCRHSDRVARAGDIGLVICFTTAVAWAALSRGLQYVSWDRCLSRGCFCCSEYWQNAVFFALSSP